jgi:molybdate transport system ATP-binding protein
MTHELEVDIEKRFRSGTVVRAAFRHPLQEFSVTAIVGPSGCGKTTILRCVAGLEQPDFGQVRFGEETWCRTNAGIRLPPQRRGIGYLFQEYALFPHLDVAANVGFGAAGRASRADVEREVARLLDLLHLQGLERRYPGELSGGQQQRVALARTLATQPRLLLLDEPLSALDTPTRTDLRRELRPVLERFAIPTLLVTHDAEEVRAFARRVVVMDAGRVLQAGPLEEVAARPATPMVSRILGLE